MQKGRCLPLSLEVFHDIQELVVDARLFGELRLDLIQEFQSVLQLALGMLKR
jgi:hypothetical protein